MNVEELYYFYVPMRRPRTNTKLRIFYALPTKLDGRRIDEQKLTDTICSILKSLQCEFDNGEWEMSVPLECSEQQFKRHAHAQ